MKRGSLGRIAQCCAQSFNRVVDTVIEVDKRVRRPDFLTQLVSGNQLPGPLQQRLEDLKGLPLYLNADSISAQFAAAHV
jgi:hypothetical protein